MTVHVSTAELIARAQAVAGDVRQPGQTDRIGYGMHVNSGRYYYPLDPRPEEVFIDDIAHGLAHQCRFNGQSKRFLSVAEHTYFCSLIVPPKHALEALMHDAAEAYIGDIIRPLKLIPALREVYLPIEAANEAVIAERYRLTYPWSPEVKRADEQLVSAEMDQNISNPHKGHLHEAHECNVKLQFWSPAFAKGIWMGRFMELAVERGINVF